MIRFVGTIAKTTNWMSPQDYIEGERHSEIRHEYVGGYVYAMAGASDDHNRIAGNIFSALHERLRGKRCEPFMADMKLKIPGGQVFFSSRRRHTRFDCDWSSDVCSSD